MLSFGGGGGGGGGTSVVLPTTARQWMLQSINRLGGKSARMASCCCWWSRRSPLFVREQHALGNPLLLLPLARNKKLTMRVVEELTSLGGGLLRSYRSREWPS